MITGTEVEGRALIKGLTDTLLLKGEVVAFQTMVNNSEMYTALYAMECLSRARMLPIPDNRRAA